MRMVSIESGSTGNCAYIIIEKGKLIFFDIGLPYSRIYRRILVDEGIDLDADSLKIAILLTHQHGDHWQPTTYKRLLKNKKLDVELIFPEVHDYTCTWEGHEIASRRFRHGKIHTNFFVVDSKYGYLTDCDSGEAISLIGWEKAYYLDELFIESNYDESYLAVRKQASLAINYDVMKGFTRHLSRQWSDWVVNCLNPKEDLRIHQSSRFYEPFNQGK